MKKILILLPIVLILFSSCDKREPVKDVDACVKKINLFNTTFEKFNADGVISHEKTGEKDSEYDQLKKYAREYYEAMNKINDNIAEEKKEIKEEEGEASTTIGVYEKTYKEEIEKRKTDIDKATQLFINNLNSLQKE